MKFLISLLFIVSPVFGQVEGREWEETGAPQDLGRVLRHMPEGTRSHFEAVPMRDGVRLATTIFLPPGDGPWPVLLQKGFYGRFGMADGARAAADGDRVFIIQDARGRGDSEDGGTFDPASFEIHIRDMEDALAWIKAQPWCNGRIGVSGGSGNGIAAYHAFLSGSPHLHSGFANNSSGFANDWMFENRVRRGLATWMSHNNLRVSSWPRPNPGSISPAAHRAALRETPVNPDGVFIAHAAWYDILTESALEFFEAFHDRAKVYVLVSPGWHGGGTRIDDARWPGFWSRGTSVPRFNQQLVGDPSNEASHVLYYLMGDPANPDSVGNTWRRSETWPPPHQPLRLHLHGNGDLAARPAASATRSYTYDPRDPTPAYGGNGSYSIPVGPMDQRPLRQREDIIYFTTGPLNQPLIFAGRVSGQLRISTDAPDTLFVLKLIDLHPEGRETLIRETAVMARFAEELDGEMPLRAGQVYTLPFEFWSTAWAMNPGHRLGLIVTSASVLEGSRGPFEVYEVHPNRFEPVPSIEQARPARQTLHFDPHSPAFLSLPVLKK